jgi:hypothetical protein
MMTMIVFLGCCILFIAFAKGSMSSYKSSTIAECTLEKTYHPSPIEQFWVDHVNELADYTRFWVKGCAKMQDFKNDVNLWMDYWNERESWIKEKDLGHLRAAKGFNEDIFSYFSIRESCGGRVSTASVPIEPLVSFLRHPMYICFEWTQQLNKDYMLPMFIHETFPRAKRMARGSQKIMFDLGASTYYKGLGGASQQWFIETYKARGIEFDRILAWEATLTPPSEIFDVPADVMGKLSYFNVPAKTGLDDVGNPMNILKRIAHVDDLVVVKIDIDNDKVELSFINQILADPEISDRIDELYFEHHVSMNPMEAHGWRRGHKLMNITQSYQLFSSLRKLGIRAHSWV